MLLIRFTSVVIIPKYNYRFIKATLTYIALSLPFE